MRVTTRMAFTQPTRTTRILWLLKGNAPRRETDACRSEGLARRTRGMGGEHTPKTTKLLRATNVRQGLYTPRLTKSPRQSICILIFKYNEGFHRKGT